VPEAIQDITRRHMPKLKTNKALRKRIRFTKTGKIKHFKAGRSHLLTSKRSKRKRKLGRPGYAAKGEEKILKTVMPYGA